MSALFIDLNQLEDPEVQQVLLNMLSGLTLQPRPSLNLPAGIEQFKGFSTQGQYSTLSHELPFQPILWKTGKYLPRLACSLTREEVSSHPTLHQMIETALRSHPLFENSQYESVWINHYRNGQDHTPYHQDSYDASVMMISVGAPRTLLTKQVSQGGEPVPRAQSWQCEDGDVTVFTPEWNDRHQHSVPKRTRVDEGRISIVVFLT